MGWEELKRKGGRYKPMADKEAAVLEAAWRQYETARRAAGRDCFAVLTTSDNMEVRGRGAWGGLVAWGWSWRTCPS